MNENQKPLRVKLKPAVAKWLANCEPKVCKRIELALRTLQTNPTPPGVKKLVGHQSFRLRVGDYRIVYEIRDAELLILVIKIGHRREVYKSK